MRDILTLYVPEVPLSETLVYRMAKRTFDVVVATTAIILLLPLMTIVAAFIYFEDRGPVIYRHARIGRYGVPFMFYKLRSMYLNADAHRQHLMSQSDAEGVAFKMKNDPRVTKIGRIIRKFSIDEAPQLFSVLAGHMSIIGPRPHLRSEIDHYRKDQLPRLLVKPGLLCLREIKGRSDLSFEEWVRLDLEYVRDRSLWLDLKIFLLAIPAVLRGHGAY